MEMGEEVKVKVKLASKEIAEVLSESRKPWRQAQKLPKSCE